MVLFAKVIPKNIEGTVFAFLTGTINFGNGVVSPMTGSFINDLFVGVTRDNMTSQNFIKLVWIETFSSLIPILFLKLIPLKSQIQKLQDQYALEEEAKKENMEAIVLKKDEE